jgi:hypothetical protein
VVSWAAEMNHGVNGSLVDKNTGMPIVYSDHFAEVLSLVSAWIGNGFLKNEFDKGDVKSVDVALERWLQGKSIFLRAYPSILPQIAASGKEYQIWPHPLFTFQSMYGVSSLRGKFLAINPRSSKLELSYKVLEYLTGINYQRKVVLHRASPNFTPAYRSLFFESAVCQMLGKSHCKALQVTQASLRPSKQTGAKYQNASSIISNLIVKLLGETSVDIENLLDVMDTKLGTLLGYTKHNNTIIINPVKKSSYKNLTLQLFALSSFIGVIVSLIYWRKRRTQKPSEALPLTSVKVAKTFDGATTEVEMQQLLAK